MGCDRDNVPAGFEKKKGRRVEDSGRGAKERGRERTSSNGKRQSGCSAEEPGWDKGKR